MYPKSCVIMLMLVGSPLLAGKGNIIESSIIFFIGSNRERNEASEAKDLGEHPFSSFNGSELRF
jgi:hypothetical protein